VTDDQTNLSGVPLRYAGALFELAQAQGALDAVAEDMASIERMLEESEDLRRLVRSPVFSVEEQWNAFSRVLQQAGISGLAFNFVGLVARNRRLFALADMTRAYRQLLAAHRGEVTAEVTTAHPLSDAHRDALRQALHASLGKEVRLRDKVDPSLLGGLIVRVGSRMIDSSIRTKLNALRFAMKEVG
jgi:F-type H+-transporting ATPase subunit delta